MFPKPTVGSNADYPARVGAAIDGLNRRLKGNLLRNGAFQVWQRGTSFASGAAQIGPDGWAFYRTGAVAGATLLRQAGVAAQYACRMQRDNANASVATLIMHQALESADCIPLAGLPVTIKMRARCGANFSAAGGAFTFEVYTGTGTDEDFSAGFTGSAALIAAAPVAAVGQAIIGEYTATIPAGTKQLAYRITWTPTGVAGAADWLEVEECQFVVGDYAGEFPYRSLAEELAILRRFCNKSFLMDTAPATNVGANTGESTWAASQAAATAQRSPQIRFEAEMRKTPTITLYNPAAANAQVRDENAAVDCSATATANVSRKGFNVTCTGAAGTAIAFMLGIHWLADADLK